MSNYTNKQITVPSSAATLLLLWKSTN